MTDEQGWFKSSLSVKLLAELFSWDAQILKCLPTDQANQHCKMITQEEHTHKQLHGLHSNCHKIDIARQIHYLFLFLWPLTLQQYPR